MDAGARKRRFWLRMIWVSVCGILAAPVLLEIGLLYGMTRSFAGMNNVPETINSSRPANDISLIYLATIFATIISFTSLIFLIVSVIRYRSLPKPC